MDEALDALENDHAFLLKGDVFDVDVIRTWIDYKREKELAEMAGLTIETTVRLLKDFESHKVIQRHGKDIFIKDVEKLKVLSGNHS